MPAVGRPAPEASPVPDRPSLSFGLAGFGRWWPLRGDTPGRPSRSFGLTLGGPWWPPRSDVPERLYTGQAPVVKCPRRPHGAARGAEPPPATSPAAKRLPDLRTGRRSPSLARLRGARYNFTLARPPPSTEAASAATSPPPACRLGLTSAPRP